MTPAERERLYYDTLRRIVRFHSPDQIRRIAEKQWGLSYEEALAMAYENIQFEAKDALKGKRRP